MNLLTTFFGRRGRSAARGLPVVVLLAAAVLMGGCSVLPEPKEDPTRYYLLTADPAPPAPPAPAEERTLNIGIRVVELPGYLRNNRTLVVRNGVNEVKYQDYARWAEPLDVAVQRIVRDRLLGNSTVATAETAPFTPEVRRDLDVAVRVFRCEGGVDGAGRKSAQFSATYEISQPGKEGRMVVRKNFEAPATDWNGTDYSQLAAQLAQAAAALGDEIAAALPKK